jgi:hypothetical protein
MVFIEPYPKPGHGITGSLTVRSPPTEAIIEVGGMIKLTGYGNSGIVGGNTGDSAKITIQLVQAHDARPIVITHHLSCREAESGQWGLWGIKM